MRKKAPVLLLVVFAVFLGIAVFHPLSHGLDHEGDDGHDCPVCLWLGYVVIALFFSTIFSVLFRVILRFSPLLQASLFKAIISSGISRAPPQSYR